LDDGFHTAGQPVLEDSAIETVREGAKHTFADFAFEGIFLDSLNLRFDEVHCQTFVCMYSNFYNDMIGTISHQSRSFVGILIGNIDKEQHSIELFYGSDGLIIVFGVPGGIPHLDDSRGFGDAHGEDSESSGLFRETLGNAVDELGYEGCLACADIPQENYFEDFGWILFSHYYYLFLLIYNIINLQTPKMSILILLYLLLSTLFLSTFPFTIPANNANNLQLTQKCTDVLPYSTTRINHDVYYTWYGKVGEQLNGTTYQPGHVFERHIAVNGQCTAQQKTENKTVFYSEDEFYKALSKDTTNCTMTSLTQFNFNQNYNIPNPSDYIRGIDCNTGTAHLYGSYFVEYKRAIQKPKPTQEEYMASMKATIWTFYPKR
jgi:hypothetical protein